MGVKHGFSPKEDDKNGGDAGEDVEKNILIQ
jgi:hypothetical protein